MDTIPLLPDFLDLLRFLNGERVEYLVIGGMAVNYDGYHRSTGDLDDWVAISPENQDRLAAALTKFGFSANSVAHRPLLEEKKFFRIGEQPVRVEIHGGISGVDFRRLLCQSRNLHNRGTEVPFISLQDLRPNNVPAGRTKDQADLESLPGGKPKLAASTAMPAIHSRANQKLSHRRPGDRQRVHAQLLGPADHPFDRARPVEQAERRRQCR